MGFDGTVIEPPGASGAGGGPRLLAFLQRIASGCSEFTDTALWAHGSEEKLECLTEAYAVRAQLDELITRMLADADASGLADTYGASSTAALTSGKLRIHPGQAKADLELGKRLGTEELTPTRSCLAAGAIGRDHARVITTFLAGLPDEATETVRARVQAQLLEWAGKVNPSVLERKARTVLDRIDPELADQIGKAKLAKDAKRAERERTLSLFSKNNGTWSLKGLLTETTGIMLATALEAFTKPVPGPDGQPDNRIPTQRNHDGFGELLELWLATGDSPKHGQNPVQVVVTITDQDLFDAAGAGSSGGSGGSGNSGSSGGSGGSGNSSSSGSSGGSGGAGHAYRDADSTPNGDGTAGGKDSKDQPADSRPDQSDTTSTSTDGSNTTGPNTTGPAADGPVAREPDVEGESDDRRVFGARYLRNNAPVTPEDFAIAMCTGQISFVYFYRSTSTGGWVPSDTAAWMVDAERAFTGNLRRLLEIRDRGCAFPHCDRPPSWCHGHHIKTWAEGGPTTLSNGVLLCGYHHRLVHRGEWQVRMGEDGLPEFIPPAYIDPERKPQRNSIHRD